MTEPQPLSEGVDLLNEFARSQMQDGVRGLVLGEEHKNILLPRLITESLPRLKEQGVSTLYVEYLGRDQQELLDQALRGDERAQRSLRADIERGFGYTAEAAQARYDMIMTAGALGMRVLAADTPRHSLDQTYDYASGSTNPELNPDRLGVGDAFMARTVREYDDKKPFLVVLGAAHTSGENFEHVEGGLSNSIHGGVEARLRAAGIPSVSLDMDIGHSGPYAIERHDGLHSDFKLTLPEDMKGSSSNLVLETQANAERLGYKLSKLEATESDPVKRKLLADAGQSISELTDAFNSCADKSVVQSRAESMLMRVGDAADIVTDRAARGLIESHLSRLSDRLLSDDPQDNISADIQKQSAAETRQSWQRPGGSISHP